MGGQEKSGSKPARRLTFQPKRHGIDEPPRHFAGRLTLNNIYGSWWASARDGFFTVRWGRFFAYLHQFDPQSRAALIAACEVGEHDRDHPHGLPGWEADYA